jgi:hypothetical protein
MPLIKPCTNPVTTVRHIGRLQEPNRDALVRDARAIGDTADSVLNQLIETTIAKGRQSVTWRAQQSAEAAPTPNNRDQPSASYAHAQVARQEDAMRFLVEYRFVPSLALSAITGVIGPQTWPFPAENVFLALIQVRQPIIAGFSSNVKA